MTAELPTLHFIIADDMEPDADEVKVQLCVTVGANELLLLLKETIGAYLETGDGEGTIQFVVTGLAHYPETTPADEETP